MKHRDPRLAPIANPDGSLNPAAVEALLERHPSTLTLAELVAMHVVFFEIQYREDNPLAEVAYAREWLDAFIEVIGGTVTREKVRHGKTVERSVRRYRGREDVRRFRAQQPAAAPAGLVRTRPRERRPRAHAARSSAKSGDSGDSEISRRRELRHVAYALTAFLRTIGGTR